MGDVMSEIKVFNSTRKDGIMSSNKIFYKDGISREKIIKDLRKRRIELGKKIGIDGTKMIVPHQNLSLHQEGHYEDVTERVIDLLLETPSYDLWDLNIPCDIMLIRSDLRGVALSFPVADCPVIILKTNDTIALSHSGATCIDRLLPMQTVEAIKSVSNAEIKAYIGPCAGASYIYEEYPNWAKHDSWKYFIKDTQEGYKINLKEAVKYQLEIMGIEDIKVSPIDTIIDERFYSNYAYKHGNNSKNGRFLVGAYFTKDKVKTKKK